MSQTDAIISEGPIMSNMGFSFVIGILEVCEYPESVIDRCTEHRSVPEGQKRALII